MAQPVPEDFEETVREGCTHLSKGADFVMFVAEMLGNDTFELDTEEFHILIKKRSEDVGESGEDRE